LNCQHPVERWQWEWEWWSKPKYATGHAEPLRPLQSFRLYMCVFNALGVDCYNNIAQSADLRL